MSNKIMILNFEYKTLLGIILIFLAIDVMSQHIPYRDEENWGIVDTSLNVIVKPRFSKVYSPIDSLFIGVVSRTEHQLLSLKDENIFKTKTSSLKSFKPEELILNPVVNAALIIAEIDDKNGLYKISNFADPKVEIILDTIFDNINIRDSIIIASNSKGFEEEVNEYKLNSNFQLELLRTYVDTPVFESTSSNSYQSKKRYIYKLSVIENENSLKIISANYLSNRRSKEKIKSDTIEQNFKEVRVVDLKKYCNGNSMIMSESERRYSEEENIYFENSAVVKGSNDKYGLINAKGELVIPIIYDFIDHHAITSKDKEPLYRCRNGEKWGVINSRNDIVIPLEYDSLYFHEEQVFTNMVTGQTYDNPILVTKNDLLGIVNWQNKIILSFDEKNRELKIHSENMFGHLILEKNGLYGICDNNDCILPAFKSPPGNIFRFNNYLVASILDENDYFIGYEDKHGTKYYKN